MGEAEAVALSDFLLPMLAADPLKRQGAKQMLSHPWLRMRSAEDELAYLELVGDRPAAEQPKGLVCVLSSCLNIICTQTWHTK